MFFDPSEDTVFVPLPQVLKTSSCPSAAPFRQSWRCCAEAGGRASGGAAASAVVGADAVVGASVGVGEGEGASEDESMSVVAEAEAEA